MKKKIIDNITKDQKIIKKAVFENLFRLMIDYRLTTMFGKKGFGLKEHIDFILDMITKKKENEYLTYLQENMLKAEEPEKYLKAVQLILGNIERYFWFWMEDNFPDNLMQNLIELSDIFNSFRDKLSFGQFRNDLKMDKDQEEESDKIVDENRFFLYRKTRDIKDYFESILESTTDGVISTDVKGKIILFNKGAVELFGYEPEEIFHKGASILYADPDRAEALKEALIAGGGRVHSFETTMLTKEGDSFPALISASLLKKKDGTSSGVVRYIKNISALKEMEAKLRELSEFKTRYLHNISHEIKTPISTIIGFVDIISKYYNKTLDINVQRYMEKISATSKVLIDLLDTLLDLSMVESGKLEVKYSDVDLAQIVEDVKIIFLPLLSEKGIDFSTSVKMPGGSIRADRSRVRQIIFNLVSNALKYTGEGGKVSLKISSENDSCKIVIFDTGEGIKEEDIESIFDEFSQLSSKQTIGSGLGLPLAKHLVELHGGEMKVESKVGIGSKFIVTLPVNPDSAQ